MDDFYLHPFSFLFSHFSFLLISVLHRVLSFIFILFSCIFFSTSPSSSVHNLTPDFVCLNFPSSSSSSSSSSLVNLLPPHHQFYMFLVSSFSLSLSLSLRADRVENVAGHLVFCSRAGNVCLGKFSRVRRGGCSFGQILFNFFLYCHGFCVNLELAFQCREKWVLIIMLNFSSFSCLSYLLFLFSLSSFPC